MDLTVARLFDYLNHALSPEDRAATEQTLARSAEARTMLNRLSVARSTVQSDLAWSVPTSALEAALALGVRIERRQGPSIFERLSAAVSALVADLRFDSRLEGSLVGLRGGTGFALSYRAGDVEVDLECDSEDEERFTVLGQISAADGPVYARVSVFAEDSAQGNAVLVTTSAIDMTGMFRVALGPGRYLFRFAPTSDGHAVDVRDIEIP